MVPCVHPSVLARNVQELAAWIKSQPGRVDYGSPSVGSPSHLSMELFRNRIGNPPIAAPRRQRCAAGPCRSPQTTSPPYSPGTRLHASGELS